MDPMQIQATCSTSSLASAPETSSTSLLEKIFEILRTHASIMKNTTSVSLIQVSLKQLLEVLSNFGRNGIQIPNVQNQLEHVISEYNRFWALESMGAENAAREMLGQLVESLTKEINLKQKEANELLADIEKVESSIACRVREDEQDNERIEYLSIQEQSIIAKIGDVNSKILSLEQELTANTESLEALNAIIDNEADRIQRAEIQFHNQLDNGDFCDSNKQGRLRELLEGIQVSQDHAASLIQ